MIFKKKNAVLYFIVSISIILKGTTSYAQPITASVIGPTIGEKGDFVVEYRSGYELDDENTSLDHSFTDRVDFFYNLNTETELHVFVNRSNPGNSDIEFTNIFIEPKFQIFNSDEDGFDGSISTGIKIAEGDNVPHSMRSVLSGQKFYNNFRLRHNSIFAHDFGPQSDWGIHYQARWQGTYKLAPYKSFVGIEMFNDFKNLANINGTNNTNHSIGPVATGRIKNNLGYQTGVLFGISDPAPDVAYKLWFSYKF